MQYVTLGKTGLKISRMGFGGIPIQKIDAAGTTALVKASHAMEFPKIVKELEETYQ